MAKKESAKQNTTDSDVQGKQRSANKNLAIGDDVLQSSEPPVARGVQSTIEEMVSSNEALQSLNEQLERRIAQRPAELVQREREFRTLVANVPALFSSVGPDRRYRYVNRRYEELFRRPASEIVGKTVEELLGSRRYEFVRPYVEAALRGQEVRYEAEFDFADGPRFVYVNYVPQRAEDGHAQGFFALVIDITERKQAEQEIARLAAIVESSSDAIISVGLDGTIQSWNNAAERIYGYSRDEVLGKPITIVVPADRQGEIARIHERIRDGEHVEHFETVRLAKEGRPIDVSLAVSPIKDQTGGIVGASAISRDITDRKQIERALMESKDRMRAILNTASDAIITIDRRGIINSVNPATEQMFGYSQDDLIGQNVKILMPPSFFDEHDECLARYLETGEARIIGIGREVVGRHKDGSTFPAGLAVSEIEHLKLFNRHRPRHVGGEGIAKAGAGNRGGRKPADRP